MGGGVLRCCLDCGVMVCGVARCCLERGWVIVDGGMQCMMQNACMGKRSPGPPQYIVYKHKPIGISYTYESLMNYYRR